MAAKKKAVPVIARVPGHVERAPFWRSDGRLVLVESTRVVTHELASGTSSEAPVPAHFTAIARDGTQLCDQIGTLWVLRPDGTRVALERLDPNAHYRLRAISPDGRLAIGGAHEGAMCWSAVTGEAIAGLATGPHPTAAAFDAGSRVAVVVAGRHGTDCVTFGETVRSHRFDPAGGRGHVVTPALSPSGARAAFSDGKTIHVCDVASGRSVATLKGTQISWSLALLDERTLVSAARASIVLWDVESMSIRASLDVRATELAFDPETSRLACATGRVWVLPKHPPETVILDARMLA
jgi:WD40 repeat protein